MKGQARKLLKMYRFIKKHSDVLNARMLIRDRIYHIRGPHHVRRNAGQAAERHPDGAHQLAEKEHHLTISNS